MKKKKMLYYNPQNFRHEINIPLLTSLSVIYNDVADITLCHKRMNVIFTFGETLGVYTT
jgi:hypothetical protein